MFNNISWLPPLLFLSDCSGDWSLYINTAYLAFKNDFLLQRINYNGLPVGVRVNPVEQGKEAGFWHLISEGVVESERIPDMRRCERIKWPKSIINNSKDIKVKVYENRRTSKRGIETNICIWLEQEKYLVILSKRESHVLLKTAYILERTHAIETARKDYEEYIKKQGTLGNQATPDTPSTTR